MSCSGHPESRLDSHATVQDLARPFAISQPAVSRDLRVLEAAGLIETRVAGTARHRQLKPEAVAELWDWLGQYRAMWEDRDTRLDVVLADLAGGDGTGADHPMVLGAGGADAARDAIPAGDVTDGMNQTTAKLDRLLAELI